MQLMKFRVVDKTHNEAIQKALFAKGFKWANQAPNTLFHPSYQVNFLYAEPEGLCHGELQSTFDNMDYPEYLLYRGELVEAGGSNPTFEEQQERLNRPVETERQVPLPADLSGVESRVLVWFNECSLPQPQHFVDVPEVEDVRKRQHVLRSWTMFFNGILDGTRTSDIRKTDDRHFLVGDYLLLQEYDPVEECYTGREQRVQITYIQQNKSNPCAISHLAIADGYAVLSIKLV